MKISLLAALLACSLAACATPFRSQVSAFNDTSLANCCTFVVFPADPSVDVNSLYWRNFKQQLVLALEISGFTEADSPDQAQLGILAAAGIGEPRTETFSVPIVGQTGSIVTGSSTTGTGFTQGSATTYGNSTTYHGTSTTNSHTSYSTTPTYGVVGTSTRSATVYDRWLFVNAYDLSTGSPDKGYLESWRTLIQSTGKTGELMVVIPYMITAGAPYFGKSLNGTKEVTVSEGDERVKALVR